MPTMCVDFLPFGDNHPFPPALSDFQLAGYHFVQLGGSDPLFVNETAGSLGLQFPPAGLRITLPCPRARATLSIGTFAGPVEVRAMNAAGAVLKTVVVPGNNMFNAVTLRTASRFTDVVLLGGGYEGMLQQICTTIRCS